MSSKGSEGYGPNWIGTSVKSCLAAVLEVGWPASLLQDDRTSADPF